MIDGKILPKDDAVTRHLDQATDRLSASNYGRLPGDLVSFHAQRQQALMQAGRLDLEPLDEKTEAIRKARGYDGKPPLVRDGTLADSLGVLSLWGTGGSYGSRITDAWVGLVHDGGTVRVGGKEVELPARPFLAPDPGSMNHGAHLALNYFFPG